jgi:hypothetical protein
MTCRQSKPQETLAILWRPSLCTCGGLIALGFPMSTGAYHVVDDSSPPHGAIFHRHRIPNDALSVRDQARGDGSL